MVGPRAEREAVRMACEEGQLSKGRACRLIGMNRGSWRYQRKERNEAQKEGMTSANLCGTRAVGIFPLMHRGLV